MDILVIYGTHFGNTKSIAEAIAGGLRSSGSVRLLSVEEAGPLGRADLLVVGGPTEGHSMTAPVRRFLDGIAPGALRGVGAATFDTRLRWPRFLSGSAGADIARQLERLGAVLVAPTESFFVTGAGREGGPSVLVAGELDRAAAWSRTLPARLGAATAGAAR